MAKKLRKRYYITYSIEVFTENYEIIDELKTILERLKVGYKASKIKNF